MAANDKKTPKNSEEFIDYRFNQTDSNIEQLRKDVVAQFEVINRKLDDTYATKDFVIEKFNAVSELVRINTGRLDQLEDDKKWFIRTIGGILIVAVMGIILVAGGK